MDPATRRRQFLGALVLVHLVINAVPLAIVLYGIVPSHGPWPAQPTWLMLASQLDNSEPFLLAMWAAFGSGHVAIRFLRSLFILAAVSLVPYSDDTIIFGTPPSGVMWLLLFVAVQFIPAFILFWLAGRIAKWRVVAVDTSDATNSHGQRGKFTTRDLFVLTALAGLVCALARGTWDRTDLPAGFPMGPAVSVIENVAGPFYFFVAAALLVPWVRMMLGLTDFRRWIVASAVSFAAPFGLQITINVAVDGVVQLEQLISGLMYTLPLVGIQFACVAGSLWFVRMAGYRLVRENKLQRRDDALTPLAR